MSADASRIYMTVIKASNVTAGIANVGQAATVILTYSLVQANYQNNVAIGAYAAAFNEGSGSVAIGYAAGATVQGANAVAVGSMSGSLYQGSGAVALGANAGMSLQGANAVAIGANAGASSQGANAVAAGFAAGAYLQGPSAVAMGYNAGASNQGANAIAIGQFAAGAYLGATGLAGFTGANNPGWTGYTGGQGANSIAIGPYAGYETDYNLVYGQPLVQSVNATSQVGISTDGQIIILPTQAAQTYYFSTNGGTSFNGPVGTVGNTNFAIILSANGLYGIFLPNNGGNPSYVTNLTLSPVYTFIGTISAASINMTNYAATSSLNYVVIPGFLSTSGPVYWTYNASPSTTAPTFITLTVASNGLPATTGFWMQPAMSLNTGQYVLLNYNNGSSISSLLYSNNNTSILLTIPGITFTRLTQENLQIVYPIIWMGSAMSGTGQYILICNNGGGVFLSTNGGPGSTASSLVFTQILSLPSLIMWQGAAMSLSGQYMSLSTYYAASTSNYVNNAVYVSYNYGVTWFALPLTGVNPTTFYETRQTMSGNGNVLVVVSYNTSSLIGTTAIYTLTQNVNNVAIGSAAGYLNQLGNAVAIGTNAGQVNEGGYAVALGAGAGQTNIGANAVAIGAGAGALTDPNVVSVYNGAFQVQTGTASAVTGWNWVSIAYANNLCYATTNGTSFCQFNLNTSSPIWSNSSLSPVTGATSIKFSLSSFNSGSFVFPQTGSSNVYMFSSATVGQVGGTTPTTAGACGSYNLNTIIIMGTNGIPYWYYSTSPPVPSSIIYTALPSVPASAITSSFALPSMNTFGTYCVIPSNTTPNALYVSTNIGTATTPTFSLATTTGLPSTGSGQIAWTAMSGTGKYILVGGLNAATVNTLWLSSNGGGLSPTFTQLTGFVTSFTQVTNVGISSTGQILSASMYGAFGFYISYNYGVTWTFIANSLQSGVIYMSSTGSNIVYASPTSNVAYFYQLLSSTSNVNTIAIGAQAGAYNQAPNAIAMGYQAGQIGQGMGSTVGSIAIGYQAGQYNQGPNAIALGFQAGQTGQPAGSFYVSPSSIRNHTVVTSLAGTQVAYSTLGQLYTIAAKTFVIDHPLDPERYLVHACLEGPEAGVYYRGAGISARAAVHTPPCKDLDVVCAAADDDICCTVVDLPDYVCKIATNFTIELTPIASDDYPHNRVYNATDVVDNQFRVYGPPGEFFWHVYGTRLAIDVEPLKANTTVQGDGPYTWLGLGP